MVSVFTDTWRRDYGAGRLSDVGGTFATLSQFELATGRSVSDDDRARVQALLEAATAELQAAIGQRVLAGTATVDLEVDAGARAVRLPQQPVRTVTTVLVRGLPTTAWHLASGVLHLHRGLTPGPGGAPALLRVTFDYGALVVPGELKHWCIVLTSQSLAASRRQEGLGSPTVRSQSLAPDGGYAQTYQSAQDGPPAGTLPPHVAEQLRSRYGTAVHVVGR